MPWSAALPKRSAEPTAGTPAADPRASQRPAQQIASRLPPLLVAAQEVARTVAAGLHGRRQAGQGETFWQFRRYQPGDPPGAIDWRQTAKRNHVAVRETEWAAAASLWLWSARHSGMAYRSHRNVPTKQERADLLVLALADLLLRGGERVGLLEPDSPLFRPIYGHGAVTRLAEALALEPARDDRAAPGVPPLAPVPRHGRIVAVTDGLDPLESWEAGLKAYADAGVAGTLVQVLDPAEAELPFRGRVRFTDAARGNASHLIPRVEAVRGDYRQEIAAHQAGLADLARRSGWQVIPHRSDRPPHNLLLALVAELGGRPGAGRPAA